MKKNKLKKFIPFGQPKISKEEISEMVKTLKSGWIGTGPKVLEFENKFKKYIGSKYAFAFSSCTAALHIALIVSGVKKGDEVITSPLTYAATGNAIMYLGAKPVFADVDLQTYNIAPEEVERKITKKTKAIISVHFGGLPCEMEKINKIAKKYNLKVIEDAAHALGAKYQGKMIGNSQSYVCFSLYPNKNITACEGGILVTNNPKHLKRIKYLKTNGVSREAWGRYSHKNPLPGLVVELGYKYNLTDLQATLGLEQLKKAEKWQKIRKKYADIYDRYFKDIKGVDFQNRTGKEKRSSLHLYILRIDRKRFKISRNQILNKLIDFNIGASVHYIPLHLHPFYKNKFKFKRGLFPKAELIADSIFTLPLTPHMSLDQIKKIAEITGGILIKNQR